MHNLWSAAKFFRYAIAYAGIRNMATGYHAECHPKAILLIYVLCSLDRSLPFVGVRQPVSLLLLSLLHRMKVAPMDPIVGMQEHHHSQYHTHCCSAMLLHMYKADRLITAAVGNVWHDEAIAMSMCHRLSAVIMT